MLPFREGFLKIRDARAAAGFFPRGRWSFAQSAGCPLDARPVCEG